MKYLKTIALMLLLVAGSFSQEKPALPDEAKWVRVESAARDISVSMPETGYLVDNEDGSYRLQYLAGQFTLRVEMTPKTKAKDDFRHSYQFEREKEKYKYVEIGDFLIKQSLKENEKQEAESLWLYLASSKGMYVISASTKDTGKADIGRFIGSIKLDNKTLYTTIKQFPPEARTVPISSLKSDPAILEALRKPDSKQQKMEKAENADNDDKDAKQINYSRNLIILRRPRPSYTDKGRKKDINGTVRLKVDFLLNGEIGNIVLLKSLDKGLDENAFEAAKKIKFLPAEIDGKSVDVQKIVEYSFNIHKKVTTIK